MYRTLLIPTDGSARAQKALKAATRMSRQTGARLHVLNVQPTYVATVSMAPLAAPFLSKAAFDQAMQDASERILRDSRRFARQHGADCRTVAVRSASVARAIVQTARKVRADLIVMPSHGRTAVASALLGSTTQKVLASCRIPVLVHR